jgi:hypothetical protein
MILLEYIKQHGIGALHEKFSIKAKPHVKYNNLILLKYNQIDSPINPITRQCRGIILDRDQDYKIISRPYDRFANHGESWADDLDWSTAKVYEKLDGSLCTLYHYNDEWHVASSGDPAASGDVNGFDFTFKELFWKTWNDLGYELPQSTRYCYMFELCTIYNKVLVQHKESRIVLHGVRNIHTQQEFGPQYHALHNGWEGIKSFDLNSLDAAIDTCKSIDPSKGEGFVVVDSEFRRVKIKSPAYVSLSHLKESINPKSMLEIIRTNESSEFLTYFPEYESFYHTLKSSYQQLVRDIEKTYDESKHIEDRKEFALQVKDKPFAGVLFSLKQGKSKSVKAALQNYKIDRLVEMLPKEDTIKS